MNDLTPIVDARSSTVLYDEMCRSIAAAYAVDEVKDIRDRALALEVYARQAKNADAELQACNIRLRAERRCGELLKKMEKAKGGRPVENRSHDVTGSSQQTLADFGISKPQSSRWQDLASIPEAEFEEALATPGVKPTTAGLIAAHQPKQEVPIIQVHDDALWLWGRLLDFKRMGLLDDDPDRLFDTMLDHMKQTTLELAPRVAAWLERLGDHE
jgi:hypothetical protein